MKRSFTRACAGYTLIELLVASALMILLTAATVHVLADARTAFDVTAERADLQQRARVALGVLSAAIRQSGAGPESGPGAGQLLSLAPPIRPGIAGYDHVDKSLALTTLSAVADIVPARLAFDVAAGAAALDFAYAPGCTAPCGFFDGLTVGLFDGIGNHDLFTLTSLEGTTATVRRLAGGTGSNYPRDTPVVPLDVRAYYLTTRTRELRVFDGDRSDLPVVNDVVELDFEYMADPQPPAEPRPPVGLENCLFHSSGSPRAGLGTLPRADGSLARLTLSMLEDGPWCGEGSDPFDADLLRIRAVRIRLRLQAGAATHRGADARMFFSPGSATDPSRFVADAIVSTSITPLNLGAGR